MSCNTGSDIVYKELLSVSEHPRWSCGPPKPQTKLLSQGHVRFNGARAFRCDAIFDQDVCITLRDGVKLYTDVFRPASSDSERVPVIIPWSPFGKTGSGALNYDLVAPFRAGISKDRLSGYDKFEAPDPAEWCERGYAMLNVDARGAGNSEGDLCWWGMQEAKDIYDVIDWVSQQPWCNGSVAMAGNSWLAIAQMNFAAKLSHPALKAIAPWEGKIDLYQDQLARGGRPHLRAFHEIIMRGFAAEDIVAMLKKRPMFDDYWEDKNIAVERIDVPIYVVASYASMLHTRGSFHAFQYAKTDSKWLRVHPYFEWYDLYRTDINNDLQRFFDHFCKEASDGWKQTPRVRLSLLGYHNSHARTIVERPENESPLAREYARKFYLNSHTGRLEMNHVGVESTTTYTAHSLTASATLMSRLLDFTVCFDKYTEIAGYSKLEVYMSCKDSDDFDVAVQIRKIDRNDQPLEHVNYPCPIPFEEISNINIVKYLGPQGFLRASHAVSLDPAASSGNDLHYTHKVRQPVPAGTVIRLEIPIWPTGMVFEPGEGIMLRVSGHDMAHPETSECILTEPEDENVGNHIIHTGGQYRSALILPIVAT